MTTKAFEAETAPIKQIRGHICARAGCGATFNGDTIPPGWGVVLVYQSRRWHTDFLEIPPHDVLRDCVLCPKHTREFDAQFKDIGRVLRLPAQGRA